MTRNLRRAAAILGAAIVVLLAAAVLFALLMARSSAPNPLPNPNGYDDLLRAARLAVISSDSISDLDAEGLRILVNTNGEALRLLRVGLSRPCMAPTDSTIANFGAISVNLIGLKSLARLLAAEGRLAEMENRPADAARSYVDSVRLGTEMSRGGLLINRLVGIACEGVGCIPLVKLIPHLSCPDLRRLAADLEEIDTNTVAWGEILGNENRFVRNQIGTYRNPIKLALDLWNDRDARKAAEARHASAAAHVRLLATEAALRSYLCDHVTAPATLQDLVPKYLRQPPTEPFSAAPLVYRPNGTNWLLYSLGPDRVDDGGKTVGPTELGDFLPGAGAPKVRKGDLLYDSPW